MHRGATLAKASQPPCNDTIGSHESATRIGASAIAGIDQGIGIWSAGAPLIAVGYLPYAAGSPLARTGRVADATAGCRLGRRLTLDGVARPTLGLLAMRVSRSSRRVPLLRGEIDG